MRRNGLANKTSCICRMFQEEKATSFTVLICIFRMFDYYCSLQCMSMPKFPCVVKIAHAHGGIGKIKVSAEFFEAQIFC